MAACAHPPQPPAHAPTQDLRPGDLVFLDLECRECDAIATVTKEQFSVSGPNLSHVALVDGKPAHVEGKHSLVDGTYSGKLSLLEAWPERGVTETSVEEFFKRVRGGRNQAHGYYVLRPSSRWLPTARNAAKVIRAALHTPYDDLFLSDNGRYYCSELIAAAFRSAGGQDLFPLAPMFFGREGTRERAVWASYYQKRGQPIPEGKPGVSPLGIYLRARALFGGQP